jgi:hypothetical protein
MLKARRLLKWPRQQMISRSMNTLPPPNLNIKLVSLGFSALSAIFGFAYAREHHMLPPTLEENPLFQILQPVQDVLESVGLGAVEEIQKDSPIEPRDNDDISWGTKLNDLGTEDTPESFEESVSSTTDNSITEILDVEISKHENQSQEIQQEQQNAIDDGLRANIVADETIPDQSSESDSEFSEDLSQPVDNIEIHDFSDMLSSQSSSAPTADEPSTELHTETNTAAEVIEPPSNPFDTVRANALNTVLADIARQTSELRQETENALVRDLESLDEKALKYRLAQLSSEFFDRIKWEGLRQQQALRDAEALFGQRYSALLAEQKAELTLEMERRLLDKEKELIQAHQQKQDQLFESHERRLLEALSSQATQMSRSTQSEVDKREGEVRAALEDQHNHDLAVLREQHVKRMLEMENDIVGHGVHLDALKDIVATEFGKSTVSSRVHGLSAAVLMAERALLSGAPLHKEIEALKTYGKGKGCLLVFGVDR